MEILERDIGIWLAIGSLAGVMTFCLLCSLLSRKQIRCELHVLRQELKQLQEALRCFVDESQKIAAQFARITKVEQAAAPDVGNAVRRAKASGIDRKHHVLHLSRKGATIDEIAEKLMLPQGEIQLILDLYSGSLAGVARAG